MKNLLLALVLVGCASARAKKDAIDAHDFQVADPPAKGSQVDRDDMATILQDQATRTSAQCDEALSMSKASFKGLFKDRPVLTKQQYDNMKDLMKEVAGLAIGISHQFKDQFQRPRPYTENHDVHPCRKGDVDGDFTVMDVKHGTGDSSYPSGHATTGTTLACVLASAYPDQASDLQAYGHHIGELRVIGGYHHPTDIVAGEKLGADICRRLLDDPSFDKKLRAAVRGEY